MPEKQARIYFDSSGDCDPQNKGRALFHATIWRGTRSLTKKGQQPATFRRRRDAENWAALNQARPVFTNS